MGETPMYLAELGGRTEIANLLDEHGASAILKETPVLSASPEEASSKRTRGERPRRRAR